MKEAHKQNLRCLVNCKLTSRMERGYNQLDKDATQFALELLMPAEQFHEYIETKSNDVSDIAIHFQVPTISVRVRAKQLGYTGHNL